MLLWCILDERTLTGINVGSSNEPTLIKVDPNEFSLQKKKIANTNLVSNIRDCKTHETRRVIILHSLCISKSLEDRVGLQELCLQLSLSRGQPSLGAKRDAGTANQLLPTAGMVGRPGNCGQVLDHLLRVLCLPGSRLSTVGGQGSEVRCRG